jgi:hypothetical protein
MRGILISLASVVVMAAAAPSQAAGATSTGTPSISAAPTVYALQVPDKKIDIDISTNQGGGGRWYANPVWIGIGAVGVLVVLLLVVLAARGGGTTIVKE